MTSSCGARQSPYERVGPVSCTRHSVYQVEVYETAHARRTAGDSAEVCESVAVAPQAQAGCRDTVTGTHATDWVTHPSPSQPTLLTAVAVATPRASTRRGGDVPMERTRYTCRVASRMPSPSQGSDVRAPALTRQSAKLVGAQGSSTIEGTVPPAAHPLHGERAGSPHVAAVPAGDQRVEANRDDAGAHHIGAASATPAVSNNTKCMDR
jgi:hypothetical protein